MSAIQFGDGVGLGKTQINLASKNGKVFTSELESDEYFSVNDIVYKAFNNENITRYITQTPIGGTINGFYGIQSEEVSSLRDSNIIQDYIHSVDDNYNSMLKCKNVTAVNQPFLLGYIILDPGSWLVYFKTHYSFLGNILPGARRDTVSISEINVNNISCKEIKLLATDSTDNYVEFEIENHDATLRRDMRLHLNSGRKTIIHNHISSSDTDDEYLITRKIVDLEFFSSNLIRIYDNELAADIDIGKKVTMKMYDFIEGFYNNYGWNNAHVTSPQVMGSVMCNVNPITNDSNRTKTYGLFITRNTTQPFYHNLYDFSAVKIG